MSIQNPLVLDFSVQTADTNILDFSVQTADTNITLPFETSQSINPTIVVEPQTYIFKQNQASDRWEIKHNLNRYPSVTVVDTAGTVVIGGVQYIDANNILCTFSSPFSGTAYLNS